MPTPAQRLFSAKPLNNSERNKTRVTLNHDGEFVHGTEEDWPLWDSPRKLPAKHKSTGSHEHGAFYILFMKIVKILAYLLTFVLALGGAFIAKSTLLLMTSQLHVDRRVPYCQKYFGRDRKFEALTPELERISWTWIILFASIVPDIGTFIRLLRIGIFKQWHIPLLQEFIIPFTFESLHAIGLGIFVFLVLPSLDVIKGAMLTNCVCLIPAILGTLSRKMDPDKYLSVRTLIDGIFIFFQFVGLIWALIAWDNFENNWLLPTSGVLISMGWWENYVSKKSSIGIIKYLGDLKLSLTKTRHFTYAFISVWKILILFTTMIVSVWMTHGSVGVVNLFECFVQAFAEHQISVSEVRAELVVGESPYLENEPFLPTVYAVLSTSSAVPWILFAQVSAAYICYVTAIFVSKICAQQFSLALPLSLVVPTTIVFMNFACGARSEDTCYWSRVLPDYLFWTCPKGDFVHHFLKEEFGWVWLFWLASQYWFTRHIWRNSPTVLASTENLFVTPLYSGLLVDQSIIMNRRRSPLSPEPTGAFIDNIKSRQNTPDLKKAGRKRKSRKRVSNQWQDSDIQPEDRFPHIVACATMWHETQDEMTGTFRSIFRMDKDQCSRQKYKDLYGGEAGFYKFETEVWFDDAFRHLDKEDKTSPRIVNKHVRQMMKAIDIAACEVHQKVIPLKPPDIIVTPYGGRLVWTLPGNTKLTIHLKDKTKIRHKKRWSQVMYMYYLLGFELLQKPMSAARMGLLAENKFILALDGDIDFQPHAVRLLLDLMLKNHTLGAACGRIHPTGRGSLIWYQKFEYAIGHWFQKATEHVIGCVLCSPGCFSLFRGQALLADNVMAKYTKPSEEPIHYVQYDQGEDRWLCTLLLQQGYRIEYSAASDAQTHAPDDFNGFFNQRKRWVPSTMANIFDLLLESQNTREKNPNISRMYIWYQQLLMCGSVLGPGTIFLMLVGAFVAVFNGIDNMTSLIWNLIPLLVFVAVCIFFDASVQLVVAQILSAMYALVMVAVLVALVLQMVEDGLQAPTSIFFFAIVASFIVAALAHPMEISCLAHGLVYYLVIPAMYLLLIIFSLFNLNDVNWGTRDDKDDENDVSIPVFQVDGTMYDLLTEIEERQGSTSSREKVSNVGANKSRKNAFWKPSSNAGQKDSSPSSVAGFFRSLCCTTERTLLVEMHKTLSKIENGIEGMEERYNNTNPSATAVQQDGMRILRRSKSGSSAEGTGQSSREENENTEQRWDPELENMWPYDADLLGGRTEFLSAEESGFWDEIIVKYLSPEPPSNEATLRHKRDMEGKLADLKNKVVAAFIMLNAVFVLTIFLLQLNKDILFLEWPLDYKINMTIYHASSEVFVQKTHLQLEPIGLVFVAFFALILIIQFGGMVVHRFTTLMHILASTHIFIWKDIPDEEKELIILNEVHRPNGTLEDQLTSQEENLPSGSGLLQQYHKRIERGYQKLTPEQRLTFDSMQRRGYGTGRLFRNADWMSGMRTAAGDGNNSNPVSIQNPGPSGMGNGIRFGYDNVGLTYSDEEDMSD